MKKLSLILLALLAFGPMAWAQEQEQWIEVSNESELTDSINHGVQRIRLTGNITLSQHLTIPADKTVTIDLNGDTLFRNLTSATNMGCVIVVAQTGNLNLMNGTLMGGWNSTADVPHTAGGIVNKGTATLNNITITECKGNDGGAIMNTGTLTITGGTGGWGSDILFNESTEHGGGGIVNYGTLTLSGNVSIRNNTCHTNGGGIWSNGTLNIQDRINIIGNGRASGLTSNVYLTTGHVINVTGSLNSLYDTSLIGIGIQGYNGTVTSGLNGNGGLSNFSNDFAPITELSLNDSGEAQFTTPEFGVYYVERGWDGSSVTETLKLREPEEGHPLIYLQHVGNWTVEPGEDDYYDLEDGQWYIIKNNNVKYHRITVTAPTDNPANLILCDGSKLESPIIINEGHALNIFGQMAGTGQIVANGYTIDHYTPQVTCTAGIGAGGSDVDDLHHMGKLTIHGGTINATGRTLSAGIGGMGYACSSLDDGDFPVSKGGDVTIYGGTITAKGGDSSTGGGGAGIGGGQYYGDLPYVFYNNYFGGDGGTLTVYGGAINAKGGASGIGGGGGLHSGGNGGTVTIHGGEIVARGGSYNPGIGGGKSGNGGTVTINGGTVKAYGGVDAAGIGCGEQYSGTIDGGTITINGGIVEAHGGELGAGIGGGQDASGANVTIWGGEVRAYGGTDAAGIGSGEEFTSNINGGSLTVWGGKVFADGSGWGAGIGGGEDADGATVVIHGGEVTAWAGADAGNKNGSAIGSEDGDNHRGSLSIPDDMMVKAGQTSGSATLFPYETRVPACYFRPYAEIKPCIHEGAKYTVSGNGLHDTHTMHCKHCKVTITEEHNFGNTDECTVCHIKNTDDIKSLTIYLPVIDAEGNYDNGNYGEPIIYYMAKDSVYFLPSAPLANEPRGMKFAGWKNGSPTSNTFIAGANEELIAGDWVYTLNESLTLTARYRKVSLFNTSGDWNTVGNWYWGEIPGTNDTIVIAAEAIIPAGCTAQARNRIDLDLTGTITIKDGGQFINGVGVWATVEKNIAGHSSNAENGWHFISQPTTNFIKPSLSNGFLAEDSTKYDLYYYDEPTHYWRNYKSHEANYYIEPDKGYLYANEAGTTLVMSGTVRPSTGSFTINNLSYTSTAAPLSGWNLVGNPFACNATIDKPCYTLTGNAINTTANAANTYQIAPCEAVMVQADAANESVTFTRVEPTTQSNQPNNGSLQIVLSQVVEPDSRFASLRGTKQSSGSGILALDNAIVSFKEGERLEKFVFNADLAKLYIPQDGKDYAITNAERQGEMPLNFEATENGEYTIAVNPENMEMGYLHLVDNLTGADVDLLASPSYTFQAKTTDYESRFKLVFAVGSSTGSDTFAFISDGNIIVNGEGVLQMVDITGRIIVCRDALNASLPTASMTPGVYVLRLINGDNIKTQKIIID